IRLAQARNIPLFVIGVGTSVGGTIPEPPPRIITGLDEESLRVTSPIHSSLDRASLGRIASAGGGQYLELGRDTDREIANRIIDAGRRRAGSIGIQESAQDLYWYCLLLAAGFVALGGVLLTERTDLWLQSAGAAAALVTVWML